VLPAIGQPPYGFLSAMVKEGVAMEMYPRDPKPVDGNFTLVGRLPTAEAAVTIHYGAAGKAAEKRTFHVSRAQPRPAPCCEGSGPSRNWPS